MKTNLKITPAERTVVLMSKVILTLGLVASFFVFLFECIKWDFDHHGDLDGIDGLNFIGLPILLYCIMGTLLAWSFLSVFAEIAMNVRELKDTNSYVNWQKEFALAVMTDQSRKAREILYKEITCSDEYKKVLSGGNEKYHNECIERLNQKYAVYLGKIGETNFKFIELDVITQNFK